MSSIKQSLILAAVALALAGCSPLAPLNFVISDKHYTLLADQAYGDNERQKLDLYFPLENVQQAPVVIFYYGGSWRSGERGNYAFVGEALAAHGMIAVIADYRVYPEIAYPAFLQDSAAAVAWVEKERAQWQDEPQALFVMGHSAGAYNAAMLALDDRWMAEHGLTSDIFSGWIGLSGPYDFIPIINPQVKPVFHHPNTPEDSQPLYHAKAGSSPALLLAATPDKLVDPERNTLQLAARLKEAGVSVQSGTSSH
ncbi:alpha/beta hydrolase [Halopseudomonas pelagia]|uniref:alpha/beta hydrolase n=1 Tax=Halopseudomonas pelagia TaxID=553151 RepID=UPI0030DB9B14|tara:strand:+ start:386 stop:1147 length:762 start_codon:yes stop_codon:yes gene_type:complete